MLVAELHNKGRDLDRTRVVEGFHIRVFGYASSKGRDAYDFEPITGAYLEAADDLHVRTPYSKTVIEQMRAIPRAHWDEELRAWRVPFRSYEELLHRWTTIEAAARRNEPEERKRRLELQQFVHL